MKIKVNELLLKANDTAILRECPNIKWHFIGNLQTNKIKKLLGLDIFLILTYNFLIF